MGSYDNKDQRDQLEKERRQNLRLKFIAKNPSWHSNASKGIRTLMPITSFTSSLRLNARDKFLIGVRML